MDDAAVAHTHYQYKSAISSVAFLFNKYRFDNFQSDQYSYAFALTTQDIFLFRVLIREWILVNVWVVKYKDGKMVGHGGIEEVEVAKAKHFLSEQEATRTALALNKGLQESHLGYAHVVRIS